MHTVNWLEIKKFTIEIGKFEGCEVRYNTSKKEFLALVNDQIISAKSQQQLERQIKEILEVKFDKAMEVRKYRISPPQIIQVVKRGNRFFSIWEGKLKPAESYDLHEYDEEKFKKLTELAKQYSNIETEWRRLIDGLPSLKYPAIK